MKPNWDVYNCIYKKDIFICVSNYGGANEVWNYGFKSKKVILDKIDESDVGIWQPKGTKEREIKLK